MVIINNSHKNDDNSNLDIDNNANDGILNYRIDNMQIIILKNQRMLRINKNVKSVYADHNHVFKHKSSIFKLNGLNRQDKISFSAMSISNI